MFEDYKCVSDYILDTEQTCIKLNKLINIDTLKTKINYYISIIDFFVDSFSSQPQGITLWLGRKGCKIVSVLESSKNTLISAYECCCNGHFADANMLLRKYRDDLFFYLYFLSCCDDIENTLDNHQNQNLAITNFLDKNRNQSEEDGVELFIEYINSRADLYNKVLSEEQLQNKKVCEAWVNNTISNLTKIQTHKLNCSNFISIIQKNRQIEIIFKNGLKANWDNLSTSLNNYTHNNGCFVPQDNIHSYNDLEKYKEKIKMFVDDVEWLTSAFVSVYLLIRPSCAVSDDYIDHMDLGLTPPDDSQYWIAPIINDFVNIHIYKCFPWVAEYIKKENIYGMQYK